RFFFQAEDGIRGFHVTGVQTCALPISATKSTIEQLKAELTSSKTDSLFAAVNSDTKHPFSYIRKGQISPALDSVLFNVPVGTTVGPFLSNGAFEIAKVVDAKFSPDSVK